MPKNPYLVLGFAETVTSGISDEAIKRSWKKAAAKWHPDKFAGQRGEAKKRYAEVDEAWQRLQPDRRVATDAELLQDAMRAAAASARTRRPAGHTGPRRAARATRPTPRAQPRIARNFTELAAQFASRLPPEEQERAILTGLAIDFIASLFK